MPDMPVSILYLSYDGLTDPLGQSQVLPYLKGLSSKGYQFTIISAEKQENFLLQKSTVEKIVQDAQIDWQPLFYTKKPPVLSTLWDLQQMYLQAVRLHRERQFSIVHCRSYLTALIGLRLKRKYGLIFIFDMRGFWADERVEGGLWSLQNPVFNRIYHFFKRQERHFLQNADYTISLTNEASSIIHSWPGLQAIPIQVIPCCVDTDLFRISDFRLATFDFRFKTSDKGSRLEETDQDSSSGLSISSDALTYTPSQIENRQSKIVNHTFTLSYLGSLGTWYLLDEMLLFFKRLLKGKPEATFLFITPDEPQIILQKAAKLNIPVGKITITKAERREVPQLLAQSQFSIFFIKPCFSKKASSPTKMGEVLAMGLPVICNAGVGDTDYIVEKYEVGAVVEAFSEAAYDQAIARLPALLELPASHFRQAALEYFALQKGVDLYAEVYQQLLS